MANKKIKLISFIIILITSIIPIVFFIIFFFSFAFSQNISDWGSFGSFMWGYLSFVATCCYVYLFYQLTVKLNFVQQEATERSISQIRISAITDLRMSALTDLKKNLDVMANNIFSEVSINDLIKIQYWFDDFIEIYNKTLFEIDDDLKNKLLDKINELKKCKEKELNAEQILVEYYSLKSILFVKLHEEVINDIQNTKWRLQ
ncbi:MAG: hypothetical protein ACYC6P_07935 [Ignavibacteriaceae bacterium]